MWKGIRENTGIQIIGDKQQLKDKRQLRFGDKRQLRFGDKWKLREKWQLRK